MSFKEIDLNLQDNQWPLEEITHDRHIARAVVMDDQGWFYFVMADRDDDFGKVVTIETAGGGIEAGETPEQAVIREVKEELGIKAEIICKIGVVSDYYNLIHRHNLNHYFLCKAVSFGERNLTDAEKERFHLFTIKLHYQQAIDQYQISADSRLGKLLAQRELPVLYRAKEIMDNGTGIFSVLEKESVN